MTLVINNEFMPVIGTLIMFLFSGIEKIFFSAHRQKEIGRMNKILSFNYSYGVYKILIIIAALIEIVSSILLLYDIFDGTLDKISSIYAVNMLLFFTVCVTIFFYFNFKIINRRALFSNIVTLSALLFIRIIVMRRLKKKNIIN